MTYTFSDGAAVNGALTSIVDASGAPTTFKSPPAWTSSDPTIFAPTVSADGLSCVGTVLKPGTFTLTVVGDAVTESVTVNAVAGVVASFAITLTATNPPPPPPPA